MDVSSIVLEQREGSRLLSSLEMDKSSGAGSKGSLICVSGKHLQLLLCAHWNDLLRDWWLFFWPSVRPTAFGLSDVGASVGQSVCSSVCLVAHLFARPSVCLFPSSQRVSVYLCKFTVPLCSETRKLTIPPHLAYGDEGRSPVIPGISQFCEAYPSFHLPICFLQRRCYSRVRNRTNEPPKGSCSKRLLQLEHIHTDELLSAGLYYLRGVFHIPEVRVRVIHTQAVKQERTEEERKLTCNVTYTKNVTRHVYLVSHGGLLVSEGNGFHHYF